MKLKEGVRHYLGIHEWSPWKYQGQNSCEQISKSFCCEKERKRTRHALRYDRTKSSRDYQIGTCTRCGHSAGMDDQQSSTIRILNRIAYKMK